MSTDEDASGLILVLVSVNYSFMVVPLWRLQLTEAAHEVHSQVFGSFALPRRLLKVVVGAARRSFRR